MKMVKFNINLPSMWKKVGSGFSLMKYRSCNINRSFESLIGKFYASRMYL